MTDTAVQIDARKYPLARAIPRILKYLRPHRGKIAANLIFATLAVELSLLFPRIIQYIIDTVIGGGAHGMLIPACAALATTFLLRELFSALRFFFNSKLEQSVVYDMRCDLYERLQRLQTQFFDRRASGDLMSRVMDDIDAVERLVIDGVEQGVISALTVVGVFVILFVLNAQLAFYAMLPVPFLLVGTQWYAVIALARYRLVRQAVGSLNALLHENLQGMRQIKAFYRFGHEASRFAAAAARLRDRSLGVFGAWAIYSSTMTFFGALGTVLVTWRGGMLVIDGSITLGELVGFLFYLTLFYEPLAKLHGFNQLLQSARAASERVFEILDAAVEQGSPHVAAGTQEPAIGEVKFENVSFAYFDDRPVLNAVSFIVPSRSTLAIVGPTGAGKSTIVNLLLGLYRPQAGVISIDGRDIAAESLQWLRRQMSYVSQDVFLFNGTVRENIAYGRLDAAPSDLIDAAKAANCHDFINRLPAGYDTQIGERGVLLSAGERQRLSIARAVLRNAPILLLDEATASVDRNTEALIQAALARLKADRTVLVVAHRLATIRDSDQIIVLHEGSICERGNHKSLMQTNGIYASMVARSDGERLRNASEFT